MEEIKKMRPREYIKVRGANENNLKNLDVDIPRNELVVLTGMSGSGKSSLAFETIYAEGQRRYMESLSSYARMFLGQMEKPNVERIEGLSPAISIDQKSTNRNPRSTVGTVTEIYDYFRLLYARIGIPHCPNCGREIAKQTVDQMVDQIMAMPEGTKLQLLAPVVRGRKGEHVKVLDRAKRSGYVRVRIDGSLYELTEEISLDKNIKHNIEIVVDRLVVKTGIERRLADSIENVLELAEGLLVVDVIGGEPMTFSQSFSCPDCGIGISEIEPRSFSFNNPFGACPECLGLGYKMEFDEELMIPDQSLSIREGAIAVTGWQSCADKSSFTNAVLQALCKEYHFDLDTPFEKYSEKVKHILLHGTGGKEVEVHYQGQRGKGVYPVAFEGLIRNVERKYKETFSEIMKQEYETFMRITLAAQIYALRQSRTDFITGQAESMPPDGQAMQIIMDNIDAQEAALVAMFVGTTKVSTNVSTIEVDPSKDVTDKIIARVSANGLVATDDLSGAPLYLTLTTLEKGVMPVDEKGKDIPFPKNGFAYCIPGKAQVKITYDDKTMVDKRIDVAQSGIVYGLNPNSFTDKKEPIYLIFDPSTGAAAEIGSAL